jgi:hypothetical protein
MMREYKATIAGTAAGGQTWSWQGQIASDHIGDAVSIAMQLAFQALTTDKVEYGKPGLGCAGPYVVERITLDRVNQQPANRKEKPNA